MVRGNFIGTSATGAVALGNTNQGIAIIDGAAQNVIGGTTPGARNAISGNGANGILISDTGTTGNTVLGNRIGTDATGDIELGNSDNGILIDVGATNNLIGGPTPAARNVISGNSAMGVLISGAGTEGNKVQGNYIGTDKTGSLALPNTQSGVRINTNATNNTIGGTAAGTGNVISGNGQSGILLNADSNRIRGNRIGLAATTNDALGNDNYGVHVQSSTSTALAARSLARGTSSLTMGSTACLLISSSEMPSSVTGSSTMPDWGLISAMTASQPTTPMTRTMGPTSV